MARRQPHDLLAARVEEGVVRHDEPGNALAREAREGFVDRRFRLGLDGHGLDTQVARRFLELLDVFLRLRRRVSDQERDAVGLRPQLAQKSAAASARAPMRRS